MASHLLLKSVNVLLPDALYFRVWILGSLSPTNERLDMLAMTCLWSPNLYFRSRLLGSDPLK